MQVSRPVVLTLSDSKTIFEAPHPWQSHGVTHGPPVINKRTPELHVINFFVFRSRLFVARCNKDETMEKKAANSEI